VTAPAPSSYTRSDTTACIESNLQSQGVDTSASDIQSAIQAYAELVRFSNQVTYEVNLAAIDC
jgi:hypothetical protein